MEVLLHLTVGQVDSTTFTATYVITQADIDAGVVTNTATVTGEAPDGTTVSAMSNSVSTALTSCPEIEIVKTGVWNDANGDGCADVGETIDYSFVVTNTGNVTLINVLVTDPLVTVNGGPITLTVGQVDSTTFTATYVITQADIDAGVVTNTATVTGEAPDGTTVSAMSNSVSTALASCAAIEIVKTGVWNDANGDGCADVGETIDYSFTVTNTGNVILTNVLVTDPLVTVLGGPITLTVGQVDSTTFTATYVITQADIDAGEVTNTATVTGEAPDGTTVSAMSNSVSTALTSCPEIEIVKTGVFVDTNGDGCADVGETIDYSFTVTNTGNVTLINVIVTDPLVTVIGGPITLDVGQIDSTTFTASYSITQADIDAGVVTNIATVTGEAPDGSTVSDMSNEVSTDLCQEGSIALIKFGELAPNPFSGTGCPVEGDLVEYTFTVVNTGNVNLNDVQVTDPLVTVVGGPISLAAGATDDTTFTATYILTQADIDAGEIVNQAIAEGTEPGGDIVSDLSDDNSILEDDPTVVVLCQNPFIGLVKVGTFNDEDQDGCADVGETISYAFTLYNLGNVTLTNISVTDPLVSVSGSLTALGAQTTNNTAFTATYTVTQADIDNGFVENQATVTAVTLLGTELTDLSDDNSQFEDDPTITELCSEASMSVTKSGVFNDDNGDGGTQVGETISYAFTVTNTGNVVLYNIILEDPLPGIIIEGGPIDELLPGETDEFTFTATYAVVQGDISMNTEPSNVTNQATAIGQDPNGNDVTDDSDDPNEPADVDNNGDGEPDDPTVTYYPHHLELQVSLSRSLTVSHRTEMD